MKLFALLALAAVASVDAAKGVFEATDANFKSEVLNGGKNAFVKFLAPWWGHCKNMKADWDKLGKAYASNDNVMIVDADCTGSAQQTCGSQGVKGYPTIKYYLAGKGKGLDYQGGRDFNSLKSFTEKTLNKEQCNVETQSGCKPIEKKFIDAMSGKSKSDLETELKERKEKHKEAEKAFKEASKQWKTTDRRAKMASAILKKLIKIAPHDEL